MPHLENYLTLLERVDALCARTTTAFASDISCRPGCDACCRHLSIFAVEAAALLRALEELPEEDAAVIRKSAAQTTPDGRCPLLKEGVCLLYHARPIICRTHGLPLLMKNDSGAVVDFCPENFRGVSSIPGSAVIDLERLNQALSAINTLYLASHAGPERITMAEALAGAPY